MIVRWNWFLNIISYVNSFKVDGFTIFPFIFIRPSATAVLINHEKIHFRQQIELLIVLFFIIYGVHYLLLRISNNHNTAYRNIIFEKEAYANQANMDYIRTRKFFAWGRK